MLNCEKMLPPMQVGCDCSLLRILKKEEQTDDSVFREFWFQNESVRKLV